MTKEFNKAFKAKGLEYKAKMVHLTTTEYSWQVGDPFEAEYNGDYTDKGYKAIMIKYPDEYYACPRFMSTQELNDIFRKGDTLESFMAKIIDTVEI